MLKRLTIPYKTKEEWLKLRSEDITSTEVSALFNCNPWLTEFELWHRKKNKTIDPIEENEAMEIGSEFESTIAKYISKKENWKIKPKKKYMRLDGLGIGSSFDFEILEPFKSVFEIKNVGERAWQTNWKEDGQNIEAPINLEFQFQHELLVSGASCLYIGALVGGNKRKTFKRFPDAKIHEAIMAKCASFWKSIKEGIEPKPDFTRDAEFIAKLFNKADNEEEVYADEEVISLAKEYKRWAEVEKEADERKKEFKAKILVKAGTAGKVLSDEFSISLGETKASSYTVERKAGRMFRINWIKEEEEENGQ